MRTNIISNKTRLYILLSNWVQSNHLYMHAKNVRSVCIVSRSRSYSYMNLLFVSIATNTVPERKKSHRRTFQCVRIMLSVSIGGARKCSGFWEMCARLTESSITTTILMIVTCLMRMVERDENRLIKGANRRWFIVHTLKNCDDSEHSLKNLGYFTWSKREWILY